MILLWIVFISYASCWCVLCCRVCSMQPCGHLLGESWPLGCRACCVFLCFVTFPNVSWSTSALRARLAPWNWFNPFSKIVLLTVPRRYFFCGSVVLFVMLSRLFIAALWSPAGKGLTYWLLFVMLNCDFINFTCAILGQVWYLIELIPDLCHFSYFYNYS